MRYSTYFLLFALLLGFSAPAHAFIVAPGTPVATDAPATEADALAAAAAYKATLDAMTPTERRAHKKAQKQNLRDALRQYKQDVKAGTEAATTNTLLLVILAILLPPVAVLVHQGELNSKFWIALILTLLFYIPGLIYALLVIFGNAKKK